MKASTNILRRQEVPLRELIMRKDTNNRWEYYNPVLAAGEFGYITDEKVLKIGDGETKFMDLNPVFPVTETEEDSIEIPIEIPEEAEPILPDGVWAEWADRNPGNVVNNFSIDFHVHKYDESLVMYYEDKEPIDSDTIIDLTHEVIEGLNDTEDGFGSHLMMAGEPRDEDLEDQFEYFGDFDVYIKDQNGVIYEFKNVYGEIGRLDSEANDPNRIFLFLYMSGWNPNDWEDIKNHIKESKRFFQNYLNGKISWFRMYYTLHD